jgi:hypothetical protein
LEGPNRAPRSNDFVSFSIHKIQERSGEEVFGSVIGERDTADPDDPQLAFSVSISSATSNASFSSPRISTT